MKRGDNMNICIPKEKFLRQGFKLTKSEISKSLGISIPTLTKKESGESEWTRSEMIKLTKIYKQYDKSLTINKILFD